MAFLLTNSTKSRENVDMNQFLGSNMTGTCNIRCTLKTAVINGLTYKQENAFILTFSLYQCPFFLNEKVLDRRLNSNESY